MTTCKQCGAKCLDDPCIDCRYRKGGRANEAERAEPDTVNLMVKHTLKHFRDGFSSDQLQQVSPSER